jgi:hypothetical protein
MFKVLSGAFVTFVFDWFELNPENMNDGVKVVLDSSSFLGSTLIDYFCVIDLVTGEFLGFEAVNRFSFLLFFTVLGDSSAVSLLSDL